MLTSALVSAAQQPLAPTVRSDNRGVSQTARATTVSRGVRPVLPGTGATVFMTIQGNALNSTNGALANSLVRLRDARYGRIVGTEITDQSGLFTFRITDPGSYIVEVLGVDQQAVLAASQIVNVNAGEVASAIVKLPFRVSSVAALIGNTAPSAESVTAQAVAQGLVSAVIAPTATAASPGSGS